MSERDQIQMQGRARGLYDEQQQRLRQEKAINPRRRDADKPALFGDTSTQS